MRDRFFQIPLQIWSMGEAAAAVAAEAVEATVVEEEAEMEEGVEARAKVKTSLELEEPEVP